MMTPTTSQLLKPCPSFLLVDDDETFCEVLASALKRRGFAVHSAHNGDEALRVADSVEPQYALVDLCMPGISGLKVVEQLSETSDRMRIVVLTGYASIATAVEAIKLGATHYLTKPADVDEIIAAFDRAGGNAEAAVAPRPMSVDRMEWEYLQKVLQQFDGNISAAARHLSMHRRTLQRKLKKYPVRH